MRMALIVLLSISLIFTSCDSDTPRTKGRTILISVASDYTDSNEKVSRLETTPNDQAALVGQVVELAKQDVEVYVFRVDNGSRYTIGPENAQDAFEFGKLEKIEDRNNKLNPETKRIRMKLDESRITMHPEWRMSDVVKTIKSLDAKKGDLIIFHYSGHGYSDGSLVSFISDTNEDRIGVNNIIDVLCSYNKDAIKLMLIDSCFSGNYVKDSLLASTKNIVKVGDTELYEGPSLSKSLKGAMEVALGKDSYGTPNLFVIAAATAGQEAYDKINNGELNQENYGAFTFYLLRALMFDTSATMPAQCSREITFSSLYESIWTSFPSSIKREQLPVATLSPMDVVLF